MSYLTYRHTKHRYILGLSPSALAVNVLTLTYIYSSVFCYTFLNLKEENKEIGKLTIYEQYN